MRCCICLEECEPGLSCVQCAEGKCCWQCSFQLAEQGELGMCPVCRTVGWRGLAATAVDTAPEAVDIQRDRTTDAVAYVSYDVDLDEESLCIYLTYAAFGCQQWRPSWALAAFVATWLRGLGLIAVATGSVRSAVDCGTGWVLFAGEVVTALAAITSP